MTDLLLVAFVFVAVIAGIVVSYGFFMRGDTDGERVASRLPKTLKPQWSWRRGDTYLGYDGKSLAIVDYPNAIVLDPHDLKSVEPLDESVAGFVHRWVVFYFAKPPGKLRVWFGMSRAQRDATLAKVKSLA